MKVYRHRKTGTVYTSVKFELGHLATVTTKAGSVYLVNAHNLEEIS